MTRPASSILLPLLGCMLISCRSDDAAPSRIAEARPASFQEESGSVDFVDFRRNPEPRARYRRRQNDVVVGRIEGEGESFTFMHGSDLKTGALNLVYTNDGVVVSVSEFKEHVDAHNIPKNVNWNQDTSFEVPTLAVGGDQYTDGIAIAWGCHDGDGPFEPILIQMSPISDQVFVALVSAQLSPERTSLKAKLVLFRIPMSDADHRVEFVSRPADGAGLASSICVAFLNPANDTFEGRMVNLDETQIPEINEATFQTGHGAIFHTLKLSVCWDDAIPDDAGHLSASILVWGAQRKMVDDNWVNVGLTLETDSIAISQSVD